MGKIRLRHGEDEIEVEGTDQFLQKQIESFYVRIGLASGTTVPTGIKQKLLGSEKPGKPAKAPSPAEYYKAKGKTDGVAKILILGKYLEQFENMSEFTRKDVNRVAGEAKFPKDIHPQFFTNAVKQGLLRKQGQKYSLTLSGEEVLASMPSGK